jgi:NAD(P)H-hydrate epimerase
MKLMKASLIPKIDDYAHSVLKISKKSLVLKSAEAVFSAVKEAVKVDSLAVILVGKGNNGADGYALSTLMQGICQVVVIDVFGMGQRSEEGNYYLNAAKEQGIDIIPLDATAYEKIDCADLLIEAIVGTGVSGDLAEPLLSVAEAIEKSGAPLKVAIDLPIGVNPDTGAVVSCAPHFHKTVALSFVKPGVLSYPGREYAGEVIYSDLSLPKEKITSVFDTSYIYADREFAVSALPKRGANTNKGSFGRLAILSGSEKYGGAPRLTLEAALRGGVGYVEFIGEEKQNSEMIASFPEAIYKVRAAFDKLERADIERIIAATDGCNAIVIGPGCGMSEGLVNLVERLLATEGGALIIDADGINALAELMKRRP